MRVISEYRVISASEAYHLSAEVNAAIQEGWQPYGSGYSFVSGKSKGQVYDARHVHYAQPMVKYAD